MFTNRDRLLAAMRRAAKYKNVRVRALMLKAHNTCVIIGLTNKQMGVFADRLTALCDTIDRQDASDCV